MSEHTIPFPRPIMLGEDRILTDNTGTKQLISFYHNCAKITNSDIHVNLADITWIDGNMCAVFGAMLYKLQQENNLRFTLDKNQVDEKCNVLFRNGFINLSQPEQISTSSTTLPFKAFLPTDKDGFISYLYDDLLTHAGMPKFKTDILAKLADDLIELLSNINLHAETDYPFFVCGQSYPAARKVKFTVCDLGVGFLPKIQNKTKGEISSASEAILWAINGNSTKTDTLGGINLRRMKDYFLNSNGAIHIVTGDAYWSSENLNTILYPNGILPLGVPFFGTTIHLVFNKNSLT